MIDNEITYFVLVDVMYRQLNLQLLYRTKVWLNQTIENKEHFPKHAVLEKITLAFKEPREFCLKEEFSLV